MGDKRISPGLRAVQSVMNDKRLAELGDLGRLVGSTLAEISAEFLDARDEAAHWKAAFETVRAEIRILAGIQLHKQHTDKLVITEADLRQIPEGLELYYSRPEKGVRVYALKPKGWKDPLEDAVSKAINSGQVGHA